MYKVDPSDLLDTGWFRSFGRFVDLSLSLSLSLIYVILYIVFDLRKKKKKKINAAYEESAAYF